MFDFNEALNWIEGHKATVDLIKWIFILGVGWWTGFFRAVRDFTRRPHTQIDVHYSSFHIEEHAQLYGHSEVVLVALLVDIKIVNPTKDKIGIVGFEIALRRKGLWPRWSKSAHAIGFPEIPRFPMPGNREKIVPVWFTGFSSASDDFEGMDRSTVDSQDFCAGLAFFAVVMEKKNMPAHGEKLIVKLRTNIATGQVCRVTAQIEKKLDFESLERIVPHGAEYCRSQSVWTKID